MSEWDFPAISVNISPQILHYTFHKKLSVGVFLWTTDGSHWLNLVKISIINFHLMIFLLIFPDCLKRFQIISILGSWEESINLYFQNFNLFFQELFCSLKNYRETLKHKLDLHTVQLKVSHEIFQSNNYTRKWKTTPDIAQQLNLFKN